MIDRIKNKIFKCNLSSLVEYHSGGFFVRKQVAYLVFSNTNTAVFYQREEGLHPHDSNYDFLLHEIINKEKALLYEVSQPNPNINILNVSNSNNKFLLMPSIFIENVVKENLTEIILDKLDNKTQIFYLVK